MVDSTIWFHGFPYDNDRADSTPADRQRLAEILEGQGFRTAPANIGSFLEVWLPDDSSNFLASVHLGKIWTVGIAVEETRLDEYHDENRGSPDALAKLIGITSEYASSYLGFVTVDHDDDLSFIDEDPPVQMEQPLAMVYLGRRYLNDWPKEPTWAADPKARWELPAGVLLVPASSALDITRAWPHRSG